MTTEEIQKLMEFIITQQAEITAKQDGFATQQAQIIDIHFETAKRLSEFEYQAGFDIKLEKLTDEVKDLIGGLR